MHRIIFTGWLCFLISVNAYAFHLDQTRDRRYCELIISQSMTKFSVYNTLGLNECPEFTWNAINVQRLKRETGSWVVVLNGPRFMVMDAIEMPEISAPLNLAGLEMRDEAMVSPSAADLLHGQSPYIEHKIKRQSRYQYHANKRVFELIDPRGRVFVMQSYSVQKYKQTLAGLSELKHVLKLPSNWTFKSGLLKKTAVLEMPNDDVVVIQDDLYNTYQLAPVDFLMS